MPQPNAKEYETMSFELRRWVSGARMHQVQSPELPGHFLIPESGHLTPIFPPTLAPKKGNS